MGLKSDIKLVTLPIVKNRFKFQFNYCACKVGENYSGPPGKTQGFLFR